MEEIQKEATLETPVVEEVASEEKNFDGLSNREALQRAIEEKREVSEERPETPTKTEVKAAVEADPEPPSEFSKEGKDAWSKKDIRGIQKEYNRINTSRLQELSRAQTEAKKAREEGKTWRQLGEMAKPYIEARGQEGVSPDKAIMEALALINEFKKGDPAAIKSELKRIGIDLDKAPENKSTPSVDPTLQKRLEALETVIEGQKFEKIVHTFDSIFTAMTSEKTRTGEPVFPDINNTKSGIQLARELGSLTQDANFQRGVLRRIPGADLSVVVREAYKYLGGRVSGEPVKVSQSNQQHIEKSRRAAASTPGKVVKSSDASNLVGKLSQRAALARALEEHRGN